MIPFMYSVVLSIPSILRFGKPGPPASLDQWVTMIENI